MPGFVGQDSPPRSLLFFFFATRADNFFEEKKLFFSWLSIFKGKTTANMNFPRQMKLFDTNIVCFSSLNQC